jgi:hypothetical protein
MEELDDEEEEFSTAAALGTLGMILVACVLTFYTFTALSETPLGWVVIITWGVVGWVLFVVLNRKYRWVVFSDRPPEEGEYSSF